MTTGLLIILQMILYHITTATVYNYNEISEQIIYEPNPVFLRGFRNIIDKNFVIGGLFPIYDCEHPELEMVEAMLFAIDRINNDMSLLPNLTIGYDVRDSCNNEFIGLDETWDFYSRYIHNREHNITTPTFLGIVGPAYTSVTSSVATVVSAKGIQIPLISYASSDAALSNKDIYKYLLRTIPSDNLQTEAMVDLVSYFGWEYVSVVFSDNDCGISASNAFANNAMKYDICIDKKIDISSSEINETIGEAVQTLLESRATVVVLFTDNDTISALFEELSKNSTREFVWIFSTSSQIVHDEFPNQKKGIYIFQPHVDHVKEFDEYFSRLTASTNIRNPYFHNSTYNRIYYNIFCSLYVVEYEISGSENAISYDTYECPNNLTAEPDYAQGEMVPFVIDAAYAYAYICPSEFY